MSPSLLQPQSPISPGSHPPPSPSHAYPHGHSEHVCPAPRRRRSSSTSSIVSLPVRRRESFASAAAAQAPYATRLEVVTSSDVELAEKQQVREVESADNVNVSATVDAIGNALGGVIDAANVAPSIATRRERWPWHRRPRSEKHVPALSANPDPECGGRRCELEWNWGRWAGEHVEPAALVPALITQALSTGILDATTYADFETFASNQTGNAILLTLSAIGTAKVLLALTAVSFGGFIGAAFLFGHVGHWVGVRRRLWLLVSVTLQTLMLIVSAILLSPAGPRVTQLGGQHEWVVLFLFAAMSGAQVSMARQSSCQELPTAPMTSTFVDFVADHYLFAAWGDPRATPRNRRILYVVAMIGGSFIGALLHKHASSWVVVAVSVGIKAGVLVFLSVAPAEEQEVEQV